MTNHQKGWRAWGLHTSQAAWELGISEVVLSCQQFLKSLRAWPQRLDFGQSQSISFRLLLSCPGHIELPQLHYLFSCGKLFVYKVDVDSKRDLQEQKEASLVEAIKTMKTWRLYKRPRTLYPMWVKVVPVLCNLKFAGSCARARVTKVWWRWWNLLFCIHIDIQVFCRMWKPSVSK